MAGFEMFGNIILKQETDIPYYNGIEIVDDFLPIKKEILEEGSDFWIADETYLEPSGKEKCRKRIDKKLQSKCRVQLHQGEFDKTLFCLQCKDIRREKFECKRCFKTFNLKMALRQHLIKKHKMFPARCTICDSLIKKRSYKTHVAVVHFGYAHYRCNICHKACDTPGKMRHHVQQDHVLFDWERHATKSDLKEILRNGIYMTTEACLEARLKKKILLHEATLKEEALLQNKTSLRTYECRICNDIFFRKCDMKKHYGVHYNCMANPKSFKTKDDLKKHIQDHKENECCICNEEYPTIQELRMHKKDHSKTCHICGKVFAAANYLKGHLLAHSGINPYICETCGKGFPSQNRLYHHKKNHMGIRHLNPSNLYECEICQEKFVTRSLRKQHHITTHNGKRHKCDICEKTFLQRSELECHVNRHNGKKPFKCDICYKGYPQKYSLAFHMKKHFKNVCKKEKNDSPYCNICNKFLPHKNRMTIHMSRHEEKLVPCPVCKIICDDDIYLENHIKEKHSGKKFFCNICNKTFANQVNLEGHMNKHNNVRPYKCTKCERSYACYTNFRIHSRYAHGENLFHKCEICDLKFQDVHKMRYHMIRDHNDESTDDRVCLEDFKKIFECDVCKKKYVLKISLQKHLLSMHFKE